MTVEEINKLIQELPFEERGKVRDGYHDFNELYEFRKAYNAALFNEWANSYDAYLNKHYVRYDVHKSWRHHDGKLRFGGGWFIVVAVLPTGQISNHYHKDNWNLFRIPETEKAKYAFDNHTSQDCLDRLKQL